MKKIVVLFIISVSLFTGILFADNGWGVRQLSTGTKESRGSIGISGNNVVWLEGDDGNAQVMFWDGTTMRQISSGENECGSVTISDESVAWREYPEGPDVIMFWDGNTPIQISSGVNNADDPELSDGYVMWRENIDSKTQIMFWDGTTAQQISNGAGTCLWNKISGTNVAWLQQDFTNASWQVMYWDGVTTRQISSSADSHYLDISDEHFVWKEHINSKGQIMFWDGETSQQISSGLYDCTSPHIKDGNVVWREETTHSDPPGYYVSVVYWDGVTVRQISTEESNCSDPQMSSSYVVWQENEDSHWQIMLWDGTATKSLASNLSYEEYLRLSNDSVAWIKRTSYGQLLYCYDGNTTVKVEEAQNISSFEISGNNILFPSTSLSDDHDLQVYLVQPGGWKNAETIEVGQVKTGSTVGGAVGYDFTQQWGYKDTIDIWYIFTAPADDDYIIGTIGSDFDTTLAVFDDDYTEIEFNDNYNSKQSKLTLRAAAGVKYFIRIAGYNGQTGNYQLSIISDGPEPLLSDINADGSVNLLDLNILASEWLAGT